MKKKQSVALKKSQMFKAISAVSQATAVHPTYAELHEEDMEGGERRGDRVEHRVGGGVVQGAAAEGGRGVVRPRRGGLPPHA